MCSTSCHKRRIFSRFAGRNYLPRPLDNERGVVLILSLVMLVILSLLGAMALNTSDVELGISGNLRSQVEAFSTADRAIEYATTSADIYTSIGLGTVDLTGDHATRIAAGGSQSSLKAGATNRVSFLADGPLPPGSGSDPTYFQARYYIIEATAEGPKNAEARVEAQVARILPK